MAVELAVVTPIILIVLVIAIDMLVFAGECARFDHLAPQRVLAAASTSSAQGFEADRCLNSICVGLEEDFSKNGSYIDIEYEDAGVPLASMAVYHCTLHFAPWPLSIAGAPAMLEHEVSVAVDTYIPGQLL